MEPASGDRIDIDQEVEDIEEVPNASSIYAVVESDTSNMLLRRSEKKLFTSEAEDAVNNSLFIYSIDLRAPICGKFCDASDECDNLPRL
jgi:hypothetical protein